MKTSTTEITTLSQAVKEMRIRFGDTQIAFATRLGLALSSVCRYEQGSRPQSETLARLANIAADQAWHDIASPLNDALVNDLGRFAFLYTTRALPKLRQAEELASEPVAELLREAMEILKAINPYDRPRTR